MKKLLPLFLAALLLLSACQGTPLPAESDNSSAPASLPAEPVDISSEETIPGAALVGLWEQTEGEGGYSLNFADGGKTLLFSCEEYDSYFAPVYMLQFADLKLAFTVYGVGGQYPRENATGLECLWRLTLEGDTLIGSFVSKETDPPLNNITLKKTSDTPKKTAAPELSAAERMKQDVYSLCNLIEQRHPDPYWHTPKEVFEAKKQDLLSRLEGMEPTRFYYECRLLVGLVYDSHLSIWEPDGQGPSDAFPLVLQKLDKIYAVKVPAGREDMLGLEVTALGGVPIEEALQKLGTIDSIENEEGYKNILNSHFLFAPYLQYLGLTDDPASLTVTLKDKAGAMFEREIKSIPIVEYQEKLKDMPTCVKWPGVTARKFDKYYWSTEYSKDVYYIQYNSCYNDKELSMHNFSLQVKKELESGNYPKVILDLRNNGGGNSGTASPLIGMLSAQQKEQGFRFCILTDFTGSAAVNNLRDLQKRMDCVTVGRPTTQNSTFYGDVVEYSLPNSHMIGWYPTFLSPGDGHAPIAPDVPVTYTIDDVTQGIDRDMEAALAVK